MSGDRFICVHGHFYQPPRENPWLETVERQESASPFHDWNERVCRESYAPNAFSRILDERGRILRIVNNYSRISFNFGPTLLSWLEAKAPETYQAILDADRRSQELYSGHGSALAQAYGHIILPLASSRDKRTQILWGIRDFEARFQRFPEGMWLPETAVDLESLDLMAAEGIRFTILAPRQAAAIRAPGEEEWRDVGGERVDPTRPYRVGLPSGREIVVFFYDGALSRAIAFEDLLRDGGTLAGRLLEAGARWGGAPGSLTHVATDGETYGHHHRHGEMALSYALRVIEETPDVRLTNYGDYLERHPADWEAQVVEDSSWSCAHGVERWRSDCGCSTGGHPEWRQGWRKPLREALDWLRSELAPRFEADAGRLLEDPWAARDRYIEVVLDRTPEQVEAFLDRESPRRLTPEERTRCLHLLELQRHLMLMYTSCGWFFDDLARIETLQVLRYAARALHLNEVLFGDGLEAGFLARLAPARSNVPGLGSGDELYRNRIVTDRVELAKVAAHHAVASLFLVPEEEVGVEHRVHCFSVQVGKAQRLTSGGVRLSVGHLSVTSRITRKSGRFSYGVLHMGDHHLVGGVRPFEGEEAYDELARGLVEEFQAGGTLELVRILDREFRASIYSLSSLFRDEQERVVDRILEASVAHAEGTLESLYESRLPVMRFLAGLQMPQPRPFSAVGEFILDSRLQRALSAPFPDVDRAEALFREAERTGLRVDREALRHAAAGGLERLLQRLEEDPGGEGHMEAVTRFLEFARSLPFAIEAWAAQNICFRMLKRLSEPPPLGEGGEHPPGEEWLAGLRSVGEALGIAVEETPVASQR